MKTISRELWIETVSSATACNFCNVLIEDHVIRVIFLARYLSLINFVIWNLLFVAG